jgi:hypothetical protein
MASSLRLVGQILGCRESRNLITECGPVVASPSPPFLVFIPQFVVLSSPECPSTVDSLLCAIMMTSTGIDHLKGIPPPGSKMLSPLSKATLAYHQPFAICKTTPSSCEASLGLK